jgi:hypothetical protein
LLERLQEKNQCDLLEDRPKVKEMENINKILSHTEDLSRKYCSMWNSESKNTGEKQEINNEIRFFQRGGKIYSCIDYKGSANLGQRNFPFVLTQGYIVKFLNTKDKVSICPETKKQRSLTLKE